jgi:hypothetical protein
MDLNRIQVNDRIEIYTPATGTYWGYVTAVGEYAVEVDDISPAKPNAPTRVLAENVVRVVSGVQRR